MNILVDTCVWSAALRRTQQTNTAITTELHQLINEHRIAIIGTIRQELLSGIRESRQSEQLAEHLTAFPDINLQADDYVLAAKFFNVCRAKGIQGSNTDFLICAVAVQHQLAIFTTDKDFAHYVKHLPIVLHRENEP